MKEDNNESQRQRQRQSQRKATANRKSRTQMKFNIEHEIVDGTGERVMALGEHSWVGGGN